uniref:Secreted protein n=1 Tax=Gouania willdenowi TaxID=441366 RepID=A0A8C5GGI2_GOUWI
LDKFWNYLLFLLLLLLLYHLEVGRVHPQLEGVQLTDFGHSTHHILSMLLHGGRAEGQVVPVGEVDLGLGVNYQQNFGPEAPDSRLVFLIEAHVFSPLVYLRCV